jgi:hypothetical protein
MFSACGFARFDKLLQRTADADSPRENAPTRASEADTYPGLLRGFLPDSFGTRKRVPGESRSMPTGKFRPAPDSPAGGARGGRIGSVRPAQEARYVLGAVSTKRDRLPTRSVSEGELPMPTPLTLRVSLYKELSPAPALYACAESVSILETAGASDRLTPHNLPEGEDRSSIGGLLLQALCRRSHARLGWRRRFLACCTPGRS